MSARFNLEIDPDALPGDGSRELARILEELSADYERGRPLCRTLHDREGNPCGMAYTTD